MFFFKLLFHHRSISWVLFILTFLLLVYGLFMPQVRSGMDIQNLDKFIHFSGFFIVFLLGRFATHSWVNGAYWILPFVAAVSLEYLQGKLVISRDFSYLDMIANVFGVAAASGLWFGLMSTGQLKPVSEKKKGG